MHKLLIGMIAVVALLGLIALPADAAYVAGTASGSSIVVGGDAGTANQVDLAGDIVASYTSPAANDTAFKTNQGGNAATSVSAVYGDTAKAIGTASSTLAPGGVANYNLSIRNFANTTDNIKIDVKGNTTTVTGPARDSVTIRVNGAIIYQNGNDSFTPVTVTLASGAETSVTVQITHDTNGALGIVDAVINTKPNNGGGGDTGGYVGNNGDNYAGTGNASETFSVNVKEVKILVQLSSLSPVVTLPAGYNGPAIDTVPGTTLTYKIHYDNDGNDTGMGFAINTKIPANTSLATANDTTLVSSHTGSTPTITVTDDSGNVVADTSPNAFRIKWTFSTGVSPNNGDPNGTVDAATADVDAGFVQFKVYIK